MYFEEKAIKLHETVLLFLDPKLLIKAAMYFEEKAMKTARDKEKGKKLRPSRRC